MKKISIKNKTLRTFLAVIIVAIFTYMIILGTAYALKNLFNLIWICFGGLLIIGVSKYTNLYD